MIFLMALNHKIVFHIILQFDLTCIHFIKEFIVFLQNGHKYNINF